MLPADWAKEFPGTMYVTDEKGVLLWMNELAAREIAKDGGMGLIGCNIIDCHPEPSKTMVKDMLASQKANIYTIEKDGVKKLIYQSPWFKDGKFAGLVELGLPVPFEMPHFIRG
jgi:hypothetical protein